MSAGVYPAGDRADTRFEQTVDFIDLLRSMRDAQTQRMGLNHEEVIHLAHGTASYLAQRGVKFSLDGAAFEPGEWSPHRMFWMVKDRGLVDELWPVINSV